MATREELLQQFSDLGVEPNDDVLDKCSEICLLKNIDVEEFVETWMAFSLSNLNGAEPTVNTILQMERKEFLNRSSVATTPKHETTPLRIYNTSNSGKTEESDGYCITPKGKTLSRGFAVPSESPRTLFSPASYSSDVGTPCSKYKERTNARQVVLSHGVNVDNVLWKVNHEKSWRPAVSVNGATQQITSLQHRLMMESLSIKADVYNDHIENLSKLITEKHKLEEPTQFKHPNSERFVTVGRICSADSKLQQSTLMLEASETFSQGLTIELNLQHLMQPNTTCSGLFPGQVVGVEGTNPLGDKIMVQRIYSPLSLPMAPTPNLEGPLHIVIAAGPFTQADNLLYQPLEDLVSYIKQHEPHLAIIVGPVVDVSHIMIADGTLAETFEEFHDKVINGIMDQLTGCSTQVISVVSAKDAAQCPVYPTLPFTNNKKFPNFYTVGDPSMINLCDLTIGVSATDILMHLSREEMPLPNQCGGDRLGRLTSHLLTQHNLYPLHPSVDDVAFDSLLWESVCNLTVTPHILVLPSDLRYFIKNVDGCVVVNPERLAKGQAGGTFARLFIQNTQDTKNDWTPNTCISGQILKI